MATIVEPKKSIYDILKTIVSITLDGETLDVKVRQERPDEVIDDDLRMITFRVSDNSANYDLSSDLYKQDIEITVDLWALSSRETTEMLEAVEQKMRDENYLLETSFDIPDPKGYSHIVCVFKF
jgi:hypothetical protein